MATPTIKKITIYPIKALDGIALEKAMITEGGCLLNDRAYAMLDLNGDFINAKTNPLVHLLRTTFDLENDLVSFCIKEEWRQFHLQNDKIEIETFLSDFFKMKVKFLENKIGRFMDIPDIGGATIVSTKSLKLVSSWFDHLDLEETRKRFRATLEIEGVPAFWEDQLFTKPDSVIEFKIGEVTFLGHSPRERCVVPTRHPLTSKVLHGFAKTFVKQRETELPLWSSLKDNYDHFYYLSVDCSIPATEIGKWICVGDELKIIGETVL